MPLFTVVIPTRNRPGLLLETLQSVIAQTFSDFEIVVVDDASAQDPTAEIAKVDPAIRVLRQPENRGVSAARNAGIDAASGDYIALLDDDDLWLPWTLETYADAIERHGRPAQLSVNGLSFREVSELAPVARDPVEEKVFDDYLTYATNPWQPGWLTTCGAVIRHDVVKASGGFDPAFTYHEDEDLWLKLGVAPGFVRLAKPLCWGYRSHSSMSSNLGRRFVNLYRLIEKERRGEYPGGPARRRQRIDVIARRGRNLARRAVWESFYREGAGLYLALLAWNLELARLKFVALYPIELLLSPIVRRASGRNPTESQGVPHIR